MRSASRVDWPIAVSVGVVARRVHCERVRYRENGEQRPRRPGTETPTEESVGGGAVAGAEERIIQRQWLQALTKRVYALLLLRLRNCSSLSTRTPLWPAAVMPPWTGRCHVKLL